MIGSGRSGDHRRAASGGGFNVNGGGTLVDWQQSRQQRDLWRGHPQARCKHVLGWRGEHEPSNRRHLTPHLNGKTDVVGGGLNLSNSGTTAWVPSTRSLTPWERRPPLNGVVDDSTGGVGFNNGTTTISASLEVDGIVRDFNIDDSDQVNEDVIISGVIQSSSRTAGIGKNNAGTSSFPPPTLTTETQASTLARSNSPTMVLQVRCLVRPPASTTASTGRALPSSTVTS